MQLAPLARTSPMAIAEVLVRHLELPAAVGETTVLPPGFINWRLDPAWVAGQVPAILAAGPDWGRTDGFAAERFNVEFISANPTGPLHIGNGRGGFIGDALANLLEAAGAHGHPRVLRQRLRQPGPRLRPVGLPRPDRAVGRGRLPRRVHRSAGGGRARRGGGIQPTRWRPSGSGPGTGSTTTSRRRSPGSGCGSTSIGPSASSTSQARWPPPSSSCGPRATSTRTRARPGFARRLSVTTRTGSSSAPTASRPTSRPTSPTCWTSSSAASPG